MHLWSQGPPEVHPRRSKAQVPQSPAFSDRDEQHQQQLGRQPQSVEVPLALSSPPPHRHPLSVRHPQEQPPTPHRRTAKAASAAKSPASAPQAPQNKSAPQLRPPYREKPVLPDKTKPPTRPARTKD